MADYFSRPESEAFESVPPWGIFEDTVAESDFRTLSRVSLRKDSRTVWQVGMVQGASY